MSWIEFEPKEFPFRRPETDSLTHRSSIYDVVTDQGNLELAVYDDRTNLWYSPANKAGFNNVKYFVHFNLPNFDYSRELLDLLNGEGDYEIKG